MPDGEECRCGFPLPDGDDLLSALAEHLATLDEWTIYSVGEGDMTQQELCQVLAKTALAFVAERLPTREEIARIVRGHGLIDYGDLVVADALLRDWRERLGVRT